MYIPEFWCGFIMGVFTIALGIIVLAIWYNRRNK